MSAEEGKLKGTGALIKIELAKTQLIETWQQSSELWHEADAKFPALTG